MSQPSSHCVVNLTSGQRVGMTLLSGSGYLSLGFVVFALGRILRYGPAKSWKIARTPLDTFVLSLLFGDLIQALGGAINAKWVHDSVVTCSATCSTQGTFNVVGAMTLAMSVLVIAIYTFGRFVFVDLESLKNRPFARIVGFVQERSMGFSRGAVCVIWTYAVVFVVVVFGKYHDIRDGLFEPSPWCFVGVKFQAVRLLGEYLWLWISAGVSLILYFYLAWMMNPKVIKSSNNEKSTRTSVGEGHPNQWLPLIPLLYPTAFIILVLPLSVARWIQFRGGSVPTSATFAGNCIFHLSGFFDVILFVYMRRNGLTLLDPEVKKSVKEEGVVEAGGGDQGAFPA